MSTSDTRNMPADAFRFSAGPVRFGQFTAALDHDRPPPRPITIVALSGEPVVSWYWGRCVHDLAGMQVHKPTLPLDYRHNEDEVIGYCDRFDASGGELTIAANLVPFCSEDRAAEIGYKADAGVPYEASIYFDPRAVVVEEVGAGQSTTCNGRQYEGPITVFRKWNLRGVSVCPYGLDKKTSSQFGEGEQYPVPITRSAGAMSVPETKPVETKPVEKPAEAGAQSIASSTAAAAPPAAPAETPAPAAGQQAADPRAECKRFLDAFGAQGGQWFAQGLTFEAAMGQYAAALKSENDQLRQRLAGGQLAASGTVAPAGLGPGAAGAFGEAAPLSFEPAEGDAQTGRQTAMQQKYGAGLGKFAAGIALPKK